MSPPFPLFFIPRFIYSLGHSFFHSFTAQTFPAHTWCEAGAEFQRAAGAESNFCPWGVHDRKGKWSSRNEVREAGGVLSEGHGGQAAGEPACRACSGWLQHTETPDRTPDGYITQESRVLALVLPRLCGFVSVKMVSQPCLGGSIDTPRVPCVVITDPGVWTHSVHLQTG